ncbi:PLP-dependent transferase [Senegalimassilia anaerobia]|uniref:PLP-dependent transferase n=1 Tax=Senegalimassilia anaerobia TaxID=1473216 RepID=UPI0026EBF9F2|nr:PLP-dependent transferase [Senegalimassilia anaerobia]
MKRLLYIDSCVLRETSRTKRIADALVEHLLSTGEYVLEQLVLEDLMNDEELVACGISPDMVRLSCGIESTEDLLADLEQALATV